jgi:Fic family protein
MKGRRDVTDIGHYRVGAEPMKVMSGGLGEGRVHFQAPPSARVPDEMDTFLNWFNVTCAAGDKTIPALTRSGIAHLWFVSIHPFGDGNGRIGRAVAGKALAQTQGSPSLVALAHTIEANRKEYYAALESVNRTLQITSWLAWFAQTVLDAQDYTVCCVRALIAKAKFYDRLGGSLNDRQSKVIASMFRQGVGGFEGGLSANNYMRIAKTSASTATRDLQDLLQKGALTRTGELRHARYSLNAGRYVKIRGQP